MVTKVEDGQGSSPEPKDSSGTPPTDGVKSEGSGDPGMVPYKRVQDLSWKNKNLEKQLQENQRKHEADIAEMRQELEDRRRVPDPSEPDRDEDPAGYQVWKAEKASKKAESAVRRMERRLEETERVRIANDLRYEFSSAIKAFPHMDNDNLREFAFEQFCIGKDKSSGSATGEEILKGVDSLLKSYSGDPEGKKPPVDKADREQERARGKPKAGERSEHKVKAGDGPPQYKRQSLRQKLDRKLGGVNREILDRMRRSDRKTAGM